MCPIVNNRRFYMHRPYVVIEHHDTLSGHSCFCLLRLTYIKTNTSYVKRFLDDCFIFYWSSGIIDGLLFTLKIEFRSCAMEEVGASVVWHLSLLMTNNFNQAEAVILPMQTKLP